MNALRELCQRLREAGYRGPDDSARRLVAALLKLPARSWLAALEQLEPSAEECMDERLEVRPTGDIDWQSRAIFVHLREHGEALAAAIAAFLASLVDAEPAPSPALYPVALLVNSLRAPLEAENEHSTPFRSIALAVRTRVGDWEAICRRSHDLATCMVGPRPRWPRPDECAALVEHLDQIEAVWLAEAQKARETLAGQHQRASRRALVPAAQWCVLLRHMLQRLRDEHGWLHLVGDYSLELLAGARRVENASEIAEAVIDDLGGIVYSVAGSWSRARPGDQPFPTHESGKQAFSALAGLESPLLERRINLRRQRLLRGRRRCLARWTALEPDARWAGAVLPGLRELARRLEHEQGAKPSGNSGLGRGSSEHD